MGGWKTEDFIGLKVNIHEREEGGGVWGREVIEENIPKYASSRLRNVFQLAKEVSWELCLLMHMGKDLKKGR